MKSFCEPRFTRPMPPPPGVRPKLVPSGGYTPPQLVKAYGLPPLLKAVKPVKIGIGSLGGAVILSDITAAFARWGLTAPTVSVLLYGMSTVPPADPNGADVENALDVEWSAGMANAMLEGASVSVVICYGPNDATGIPGVTQTLLNAGCDVISWSWGQAKSQWGNTAAASSVFAACAAKGVPVFAASGDNSADDSTQGAAVDYPAADANVWGVGGTSLQINADGSILSEAAWGDGRATDEGGGGGYDTTQPTPGWQAPYMPKGSSGRGVPDSSSAADPNTPAAVYVGGQWITVGGTSWAAPTTAGIFAAFKAAGLTIPGNLGSQLYPASPFNDIVTGSDGYPAAKGWDSATGLGSPNGAKLLAVLSGSSPVNPPPVNPPPPPVTPMPAGPTEANTAANASQAVATYLAGITLSDGAFRRFGIPVSVIQGAQQAAAAGVAQAFALVPSEHAVEAWELHLPGSSLKIPPSGWFRTVNSGINNVGHIRHD